MRHPIGSKPVMLVVVEKGGDWPPQGGTRVPPGMLLLVLAQQSDEPAAGFAERATRRTEGLERRARHAVRSLLAVGPATDVEARAARHSMATALAAHAARCRGRVTLHACHDAPTESWVELLALAGQLRRSLAGSGAVVDVRLPVAPLAPSGLAARAASSAASSLLRPVRTARRPAT
jgi:hypothetical protein